METLNKHTLVKRLKRLIRRYEECKREYADALMYQGEYWAEQYKFERDLALTTGRRLNAEYIRRYGESFDYRFE